MRIRFHDQSPCGRYSFEDYGICVVLDFAGGGDLLAQGDDADRLREEWDACVEAGFFAIFEEYRPEVNA